MKSRPCKGYIVFVCTLDEEKCKKVYLGKIIVKKNCCHGYPVRNYNLTNSTGFFYRRINLNQTQEGATLYTIVVITVPLWNKPKPDSERESVLGEQIHKSSSIEKKSY